MKYTFERTFSLIMIALLLFSLIGCSKTPKPDSTVSGFFDALKKEDFNSAAKFVKSESKSKITYDNKDQERIAKVVFSKLDYKIESSEIKGDTAIVKTKVTSVDLVKITGMMVSDLLPTLMAKALSGEEQSQAETEKIVEQYFINSINDPNVAKITTEVTINLVKSQDKNSWLIDANEELLNALTGNLQDAFNSIGAK